MPNLEATRTNDKASWDRMLIRASSDPEFRRKLLTSPNEALLSCGIELPAGVKVIVHEFDPSQQHLFLPPLNTVIAKPVVVRMTRTQAT